MGVYDDSVGPFVLGAMVSTVLLGINSSQVWTYYRAFPHDRKLYRYLVGFLCFWDYLHSAISLYTVYYLTVTHYAQPAFLAVSPWSFTIEPAMTGIATAIVQVWYAHRVWIVSKRSPYIPIVIILLTFVSLGFSIGATAKIFLLEGQFQLFASSTYGVATWLSSAAAADLLLTASLVYELRKSHSVFVTTNHVLDRLISDIISTNTLTMIVAVADVIAFAASPTTSWHVLPQLLMIKLYFNSLLVSLNARVELERQLNGGSYGRDISANALHNLGGGHTKDRPSVEPQLLVTPLGFGVDDVRVNSKTAAALRAKKSNMFSGIHVETERNVDTFVELGDMAKVQHRVVRMEEGRDEKEGLGARSHHAAAPWE